MARIAYTQGMALSIYDSAGEINYYTFGETTFSGSNGKYFKIAPNFRVLSMDEVGLTTTIRVYLDWVSIGGSGSGTAVKGYINGVQLANTYTSISANQTRYMGSLDIVIIHDQTTGQGSIDVTCLIDSAWNGLGKAESTTKIYTNTYPRASTISATSGNIEENIIITIKRASDSFKHTLYYSFGNLSGIVFAEDIVADSYSWTLPKKLYEQIPNERYGTGTITCITRYISDNQEVGRNTCSFTAYTSESKCRPDISTAVVDTNEKAIKLTNDSSKLIRFVSDAKVTISATAKNNASIISRNVTCGDGKNGSGTEVTLNGVESGSFTISATDSRGYITSIPKTLEMIPYVKLTLNPTFYRPEPTTGEIKLSYNGNYFAGSFGATNNSLTVRYRYKGSTSSTWSEYTTITSTIDSTNNKYSNEISLGTDFDYQKSYDFEIIATDKLNTITRTIRVSEGIPIFAMFKDHLEAFGQHLYIPYTLYDNGKTSATVSLSDSKENYKYIEIFYIQNNSCHNSKKVKVEGGTQHVSLDGIWAFDGGEGQQLESKTYSLSGSTLTPIKSNSNWANIDGIGVYAGTQDTIYIYNVLGYK